MNEDEKRNPNRAESEGILTLLAICTELENAEEDLIRRLKEIPDGARRYHWLKTVLSKLLNQILDGVPEGKRKYFKHMFSRMGITIRYSGPTASKAGDGEFALIHQKDLDAIIEASKDTCRICIDGQCKRCLLGKALDNTLSIAREKNETWNDIWRR